MAQVLVVDDDRLDRLLIRTVLNGAGHKVELAVDGADALRRFEAHPVELVIVDLQMPGAHGLEVISRLRDASPRPAILAVSGTGGTQLDMAEALGANESLIKPLDADALVEAVGRLVAAPGAAPSPR